MLQGKNLSLRLPKMSDAEIILRWENTHENKRYSDNKSNYSILQIQQYIRDAKNIKENKQLRMMICVSTQQLPIGAIDLFEIDFDKGKAEIGILIAEKENRNKGFGEEALSLLEDYAKTKLQINHLICEIQSDNESSIRLFEKSNYQKFGTKKNQYFIEGILLDTYFYQKFI